MKHPLIQEALESLCLSHAFFASIALLHKWEESTTLPTFATDGVTMFWNRSFADKQTFRTMRGLIIHEVMHPALMHHTRRGDREPKRWNRACDYAINLPIKDAGEELPEGGLLDERFRGMDAESIYRILEQENDKPQQDAQGNPQDGPGEVMDAPGDATKAEQETKVMVAQAQAMATRAGQMPVGVARELEAAREPRVPWREVLARFLSEQATNDYSMAKPNRRYAHLGVILPSLYSLELGEVWMGWDTSGSITTAEVSDTTKEALAVLAMQAEQGTRPKLHAIYCDSRVQGTQTLEDESDAILPKGGGGTDYRPVFAYLEAQGIEPRCLIYMTDGDCNSFPEAPAYPVLWGLIRRMDGFNPPFGEVFKAY